MVIIPAILPCSWAKTLHKSPREIAGMLIDAMPESDYVEKSKSPAQDSSISLSRMMPSGSI